MGRKVGGKRCGWVAGILMAALGFASPALAKTSLVLRGDIAYRTLDTADVWNLEPRRNPFADGDFAAILGAMEAHASAVKAAKEEADAKTAALRERAEADRQACLASFQDANSKVAKRKCRPKAVRKVAPTAIRMPAFSLPQSDGHRLDGVHQAILEHKAGPKPAGWEAKVEEIRNEPDFSRKLELADAYVDAEIRYVDRWGRWALAPRAAFSGGGICRDFAVAKFIILTEAGVPAEALRLVTVTDRGVTRVVRGKVKSDNFHVMLMAKDEASQVYVLDMLASDIALGGKAWKLSESPQRHRAVEWAGTLGGSMTADRWHHKVSGVVAETKNGFLLADASRRNFWTATKPYGDGYLVATPLDGGRKGAEAWLKKGKASTVAVDAPFGPLPSVKGDVIEAEEEVSE